MLCKELRIVELSGDHRLIKKRKKGHSMTRKKCRYLKDGDSFILTEFKQMPISRDDTGSAAFQCAFKDSIVSPDQP
jgi:hypothetical protein